MKRDNIVSKIEERDLKQLQQILKSIFNNNISYEEMQNLYKMSKDNKDNHVLGYYINDNLVAIPNLLYSSNIAKSHIVAVFPDGNVTIFSVTVPTKLSFI